MRLGSARMVTMALVIAILSIWGCQSTYYAVWEKLGKEKRHLLRDQVDKARSEQEEATEEFKDALTRVKEIYGFKGGDLEKMYERLLDDYQDCENRSKSIDQRIQRVEQTAGDLFKEWQEEINQISNPKFKANSRKALKDTKRRYSRLRSAMKHARSRMTPVLKQLNDYVLYLKHNLNARAIGSLKKEVQDITLEVDSLVADIQQSIKAADDFLKNFK